MSTKNKKGAMIAVPLLIAIIALSNLSRTAAFSNMRSVDMVTLLAAVMAVGVALTAVFRYRHP